jgi:hypothetical protein
VQRLLRGLFGLGHTDQVRTSECCELRIVDSAHADFGALTIAVRKYGRHVDVVSLRASDDERGNGKRRKHRWSFHWA